MANGNNTRTYINGLSLLSLCLISALYTGSVRADIVGNLLGNSLVCAFAEREQASMEVAPLFRVANGQCIAAVPGNEVESWFSDSQCVNPVVFTPTRMQDYCSAASNKKELGNGIAIREGAWSLTPGNRLDFGSRSLEGVRQPYVQRTVFRRIQTERGSCDLEMRIYKSHPAATGQRSMLALHGGSWTARAFGYLGLEFTIPHYVNEGFVVYAPFHRLLDDNNSSSACNQAEFDDVINDVNFSLDWVFDNAERYGSSGTPVVFGQSSGGHLALSLALGRTESISGLVVMYPPTDFTDFIQRVQSGAYTNSEGLNALGRVVGGDAAFASVTLPIVAQNSFPQRIASQGNQWPPMFILQGAKDDLVESRHSVRLCDALAGRELSGVGEEVATAAQLRDVITCSAESTPASQLHLFQKGKHAIDICISPNIGELCQSGGKASRSLVSQSIGEAVLFSLSAHEAGMNGGSLGADWSPVIANTLKPIDFSEESAEDTIVSTGTSMLALVLLPFLRVRRSVQRTLGSIR